MIASNETASRPSTTPTGSGQPSPGGGQPPTSPGSAGGTAQPTTQALHVRLQLMPQSLRAVLRSGISVAVSSNQPANGIAQVSVSRSTAKRAQIKTGRGASVAIGVGTVSAIKDGTVRLHLLLAHAVADKLKALTHMTLSVKLWLVAAAGDHLVADAAGHY